ncbi:hypothetical protein [Alkalihalobacillus sp. TS-13]|uniref:hypothetical protein n=1 Tax=Alkalihalobacillus sp. TS-13 TaxID=2842455 RepID=UPI001C880B84|nr:hypothetical protein [Alkalihalobacillus sp. TS-13]
MYDRYNDIERVTQAMKALKTLNEPCYEGACQSISDELHDAIAFETRNHRDMSRYSSMLWIQEN